jgi:hypothetical protein
MCNLDLLFPNFKLLNIYHSLYKWTKWTYVNINDLVWLLVVLDINWVKIYTYFAIFLDDKKFQKK